MPSASTVLLWTETYPQFKEQYARARLSGYTLLADELVDIADDGQNDWMKENDPDNPGYRLNGEHAQRSRLRLDTRKWLLSKMLPKVYGDRLELAGQLEVGITEKILAARNRLNGNNSPPDDGSDLV